MTRHVALLRGINVGGTRRLPMAELRALCADLGYADVATYIQSGNVLLSSRDPAPLIAAELEATISGRFGFAVPVIVRTAADWARYAAGSPFPDAEAARPKLLHLCLAAAAPAAGAADTLAGRASADERVAVVGDALWVDYGTAVKASKLTPAALDKAAGSPVTGRNWLTVRAIAAMLEPVAA